MSSAFNESKEQTAMSPVIDNGEKKTMNCGQMMALAKQKLLWPMVVKSVANESCVYNDSKNYVEN